MHQLIETKILHSYTRNEIVHNSLKVKYDERNMCEKNFWQLIIEFSALLMLRILWEEIDYFVVMIFFVW